MFILSGIWQDMGYGSILYIATLSTVDPCLHEFVAFRAAQAGSGSHVRRDSSRRR